SRARSPPCWRGNVIPAYAGVASTATAAAPDGEDEPGARDRRADEPEQAEYRQPQERRAAPTVSTMDEPTISAASTTPTVNRLAECSICSPKRCRWSMSTCSLRLPARAERSRRLRSRGKVDSSCPASTSTRRPSLARRTGE